MVQTIQLWTNNQVIEAEVLQLEGELLAVQVDPVHTRMVEMGDVITGVYENLVYPMRVLGIVENRIFLFFSIYKNNNFHQEGRRVPRIKVSLNGFAMNQSSVQRKVFHVGNIRIIDMSILGFGFVSDRELNTKTVHTLLPQADKLPIKAEIMIRNEVEVENGIRYGAEIKHITSNHFQLLRKYVLAQQLLTNRGSFSP
ncbi:hypothetical protein [Brevibacillus dissolubilis]|uniref:hypothetical protein n=1 Tax=Brevibacillus dissolubilis TaxID=1844116 RepID=UPI001116B9A0|nr:hypothetical protein [Brevibacillus dissolubilis]